jgi:sugar O-acyltransferase (sialic acid O-acetyltransferase NeuD family)
MEYIGGTFEINALIFTDDILKLMVEKMKNILIIGARGFGREHYKFSQTFPEYGKDFVVKGFLDDKADALDGFPEHAPILSSVEDYQIQTDDVFVCALGDVHAKAKYIEIIRNKGGHFMTLIHPTAIVYDTAEIGEGVVVSPYCIISANVKIEEFTTMQSFCNFGHDAHIGKFCSIESYAFLGGFAQIGDYVTLHTRTTILPRVKVGDNAIVGAGSVAIKNVNPGITVFGIPAREIGF